MTFGTSVFVYCMPLSIGQGTQEGNKQDWGNRAGIVRDLLSTVFPVQISRRYYLPCRRKHTCTCELSCPGVNGAKTSPRALASNLIASPHKRGKSRKFCYGRYNCGYTSNLVAKMGHNDSIWGLLNSKKANSTECQMEQYDPCN